MILPTTEASLIDMARMLAEMTVPVTNCPDLTVTDAQGRKWFDPFKWEVENGAL